MPVFVVFHAKKMGICTAFGDGTNREKMSERKKETGRMTGCPLVELPEHGELIDKGELYAEAVELSGPITGDGWDNFGVYDLIKRQPVVIPASEEGTE